MYVGSGVIATDYVTGRESHFASTTKPLSRHCDRAAGATETESRLNYQAVEQALRTPPNRDAMVRSFRVSTNQAVEQAS
jgi:hypothetical protein